MKCKICNSISNEVFKRVILSKYEVSYFQCGNCGFLFTEEPYWIQEAYNSPLNTVDTGILKRNNDFLKYVTLLNVVLFDKSKNFLDYAGGYGVFTRLMRDQGFNAFWADKYATNLLARGFEDDEKRKYENVTAFEVFEHMVNPQAELQNILKYSPNIIFSTQLIQKQYPDPNTWWYYGFNHGQHVSLYTQKSLQILAKSNQLNFYTNGSSFHLFTHKKLSNFVFKIILKLAKYGFASFIKLNLSSKTDTDSNYLLKNGN